MMSWGFFIFSKVFTETVKHGKHHVPKIIRSVALLLPFYQNQKGLELVFSHPNKAKTKL